MDKYVFEIDFFTLKTAQQAFESEKIVQSVGGFADGLTPFNAEIFEKNSKKTHGLLAFWKECKNGRLMCEVFIFDAKEQTRYRATCFLNRTNTKSVDSFAKELNAKISRFCLLQNIKFVAKGVKNA